MGQATVRAHARRGYQVRAHTRHTSGRHIADILQRDLDMVFERLDREDVGPVGADPDCPHPGWYPIRRLLLDTSYEDSPILAYCCTGCAASRPVVNGGTE